MNFIILDLEWNQCPDGKEKENKNLPFEIIEIGAIKLDADYKKIDEFSELIKPCVYKEIHFKTQEVITVSIDDLMKGRGFLEVCQEFLRWCGDEYMFATWGNMDLYEFQRNMKFHKVQYDFSFPLKYYDVQKVFSSFFEGGKERRTLEYAVDFLNINRKLEFHRAIFDAEYTSNIFSKIDYDSMSKNYSIDYYTPPRNKEEEIFLKLNGYSKYVSVEFGSKEEAMMDREVISTRCPVCNRNMKRKIKWFSNNTKIHYALCSCQDHGYAKCKIRMKKSENDKFFVVKTIKSIKEEECYEIILKKDELRKKRKLKKKSKVI